MSDNFDRYGHDIITGERLYTERVIDGKLQRVPTPQMTHTTYLLMDGSLMRVCMSKESKAALTNTEEEKTNIMSKIVEGWKVETDEKVEKGEWKSEQARNYMREYSKKSIFDRIDDIPYAALANVDSEVLKVKKRLLKLAREDGK